MITYLPAAARTAKLWKNGGGSTTDILVRPASAGLENFDWRLSIATIGGSGPFSEFEGVDRSLSLLDNSGNQTLHLLVDEVLFQLDRHNPSLRFSGEARVRAEAGGEPYTVLNVMSRRDAFTHILSKHSFSGQREMALEAELNILFVQHGECRVGGSGLMLRQHDAVLIQDQPAILLSAGATVGLIAVALRPA